MRGGWSRLLTCRFCTCTYTGESTVPAGRASGQVVLSGSASHIQVPQNSSLERSTRQATFSRCQCLWVEALASVDALQEELDSKYSRLLVDCSTVTFWLFSCLDRERCAPEALLCLATWPPRVLADCKSTGQQSVPPGADVLPGPARVFWGRIVKPALVLDLLPCI